MCCMLTNIKEKFEKDGYIIIEKLFSEEVIDKYIDIWREENADRPEGWRDGDKGNSGTAYLNHPEILDILCSREIGEIFSELEKAVALHVDITYSISTELGWHQDNNMPKEKAGENYVGVWVALEDVDPDAGPFEFVPGSHKWDLDWEAIWKKSSYTGVGEEMADEIERRGVSGIPFLAKKGDVFIWHSRLLHRGSSIKDRSKTRMSLIGHYCNDYANMEDDDQILAFPDAIEDMLTKSYRYAQWGGRGAMYFVDPDNTGDSDPDVDEE